VLLRALAARSGPQRLVGVEPSPVLLGRARRLLPGAELQAGTAATTGLPDAYVDHVVSVNTVAIWPELDAGLDELHRVLRPGGTLLLAWHRGAGARSPASRRLGLPDAALGRIGDGLRARFVAVSREELSDVLLWTAVS
jgi:SAM-dependent methyltransferase